MAQPVATVTLGGTDISSRVEAPSGEPSVTFGRGVSFDGAGTPPGYATISVSNNDRAFNPRNGSSTYASVLRLGKPVRITAVYSATTYYLFHGFLRRIVPGDGFAQLVCQDALFNFSRRETNLAASVTRSINGFRGAILDDIGEAAGSRSLSNEGPEATVTYTGADGNDAAGLLETLDRATGTMHYVVPTSTGYQYVTLARTALQSLASVETWSDTDFSSPFAVDLPGYDYTDEGIVNEQRVEANPRLLDDDPSTVWSKEKIWLPAGATRTRWPRWDDPTFELAISYDVNAGSPTVTMTPFARTAKLVIAAGGSNANLQNLKIRGRVARSVELDAGIASDATSQSTYGLLRGGDISSDYIASEAWSDSLAAWYVYRYKDPRARPPVVFENRFPTQLQRQVGERVTLTAAEHSLSGVEMLIASFQTEIRESGGTWRTTYQLEEMPAAVSLFTVGGSAGQGVGGSAILGY